MTNLNDINEVWLALEAERKRIDFLFEMNDLNIKNIHNLKEKENGEKKENNQTRSTT